MSKADGLPTTTQRGLGYEHQRRAAAMKRAALGMPCPGCGRAMLDVRLMDLDHSVPRALGGTVGDRVLCRRCNRAAGARLGNRLRSRRRSAVRAIVANPSRSW